MDIKEFNNKWKKRFRPDLEFPMHIKRRIFNIYHKELFYDVDNVIFHLIFNELSRQEYFNNFCNIENLKLEEYKESETEWFLPISKSWVCESQLNDIARVINIQ